MGSRITDLDASALSGAIHERSVSCVDVMQAYFDRIDQLNLQLNAIVSRRAPDELLAPPRLAHASAHIKPLAPGFEPEVLWQGWQVWRQALAAPRGGSRTMDTDPRWMEGTIWTTLAGATATGGALNRRPCPPGIS